MASPGRSRPSSGMAPGPGTQPYGRLDGLALAGAAFEHPLEHPAVLAVAGPEKLAVRTLAEPVDVEEPWQLARIGRLPIRSQ